MEGFDPVKKWGPKANSGMLRFYNKRDSQPIMPKIFLPKCRDSAQNADIYCWHNIFCNSDTTLYHYMHDRPVRRSGMLIEWRIAG
jgi:hypothetical protein